MKSALLSLDPSKVAPALTARGTFQHLTHAGARSRPSVRLNTDARPLPPGASLPRGWTFVSERDRHSSR